MRKTPELFASAEQMQPIRIRVCRGRSINSTPKTSVKKDTLNAEKIDGTECMSEEFVMMLLSP